MNSENVTRCEICNREAGFLIPKLSKRKGCDGWKMVCRVCYDRLNDEDEDANTNRGIGLTGLKDDN